jgi:hypothetical protein
MSEKIEQVARALCRSKRNAPPDQYPAGWIDRHVNDNWGLFVDDARCAIEAMREPTEAMTKAGNKHTDWADGADAAWESMIDEALK